MPYVNKDQFVIDYHAAQDLAAAKYGNYFKTVGDDVAWSAYSNSAKKTDDNSNTLGLMLFGRHQSSLKKPITAAYTQREKNIFAENQRLSAKKLVPKVYRKHVINKAIKASKAQREMEESQILDGIDTEKNSVMRNNFGVVNNAETGSILLIGNANWNLTINDTWLLGAVHSHLPFYPASPVSRANIFEDKHVLSITGRELFGLAIFGYRQVIPEFPELGSAFQLSDPAKANASTLVKYQEEMDNISIASATKAFSDAGFRIVDVGF